MAPRGATGAGALRHDTAAADPESGAMTQAVTSLLLVALTGLPLGLAPTDAVLVSAGGAAFFAIVGVLIRNAPLLTLGVALSLVEALLAFVQGGKPLNPWLAVLLGVVIYVLLDISAFLTMF